MDGRIKVSCRGHYDSAPLVLDESPDLDELFANPPILQEATERNRQYWASADAATRRVALIKGYLQHPRPEVRLKTLELMATYQAYFDDQLVFDLLAADPDDGVRRAAANTIWFFERDVACRYAVDKANDEIAYGSEGHPVGPTRARSALALLADAAPDGEARSALEVQISLP